MSKTFSFATVCRQEAGLLGDDAIAGRKSGSSNISNQLFEEVSLLLSIPYHYSNI